MPVHYRFGGGGLPKMVKALLITNAVIFVFMNILIPVSSHNLLFRLFGLVPVLVNRLMIWQFFTYMFLHANFWHIGFNMFALWMFGTELEYNWGSRDFLKYYLTCGVGGGVLVWLTSFVGLSYPLAITIGASGAIFGLLVAYGLMWPDRMIFVMGVLPMKALHFVIIFGAIDLLQGLSRSGGGIAYFAHVGGGLTGLIYLKYGWRIMIHLESMVKSFKRRKFKVTQGGGRKARI
ncbi:rhomboid family intramembrane serine protease [Candidatus Latescibacterota bacterium]